MSIQSGLELEKMFGAMLQLKVAITTKFQFDYIR